MGIDPGLQNLGWGVIEVEGPRIRHVANGVLHSDPKGDLAGRLLELFDQLTAVVGEQAPDRAAVEQTFVNRDGAGPLKLGQARAVALHSRRSEIATAFEMSSCTANTSSRLRS